jgi:hypothetical protein
MRLIFTHWNWSLLLSPSFSTFMLTACSAVFAPLAGGLSLPGLYSGWRRDTEVKKPLLRLVLMFLLIPVLVTVFHLVAWGSFPFDGDADGNIYMRMIPFIPWPSRAFF